MTIAIGAQLGSYEIAALLGKGGMGEVYRARDKKLKRDVAIKILPDRFSRDPERVSRFQREAEVLALLNHPNIAAIHNLEEANGSRYLVLELVEGDTLAERLRRGRLPIREALNIASDICEALEAAHEKGIVHRDLKPANVKITPDGRVKVLDFGLAKAQTIDTPTADLADMTTLIHDETQEGVLLGTAAYMSPEQARGKAVDRRTDIWAFGCVLYEMLVGHAVYGGSTTSDTIAEILSRDIDWHGLPAETPVPIRRLLQRCLEKDQKRRMRDAGDIRIEIDDVLNGGAAPASAMPVRSSRWRGVVACSLALVLVAAAYVVGRSSRSGSITDSSPAFSRVVRLTSGPAHEWAPAISPDGKWVAYLSDAAGPTDVWVKFLAGGEPANLTASTGLEVTPGTGIAGMAISPDGTRIAVMARMRGTTTPFDTWEVPAPLPGAPRKMLEGFVGLQWSPDGRRTTFVRAGGSAGDALWVGDADGTSRREIIKLDGGLHVHWPIWSSNGYIYFIHTLAPLVNMEPSEIYRIHPDTGKMEPVVTTSRRAIFPLPMPDGNGLVYSGNPATAELGLWWRSSNGEQSRQLTAGIGEYAEPRVSADGRILVATLYDVHQSLIKVGVTRDFGIASPITGGYTRDLDPTLGSADDRLVFSSARSGNRLLWTSNSDGTDARPLTSGPWYDERPSVSPDGKQIAFVSDREGRRAIWLINPEGGAPRKLVEAAIIGSPAWSRDGKLITFASAPVEGTWPELWGVSVADGHLQRILALDSEAIGESVHSPTRDLIAYVAATTAGPSISRLRFVDSMGHAEYSTFSALPLPTAGGFQNGILAWAPDGKRLAVVSQGNNNVSIWIVEPEAPNPFRKLVDLPGGPRVRGITWTHDGSAILIGKHDVTASDIVLLQ